MAEYLIDLNATQAAIRAGYSAKNADKIGSELLGKTGVAVAVQEAMDKRAAKLEISAERVLQEIAKLAFLDPRKLFNADGSLKKMPELDEQTAACIVAFDVEELYEHFGKGAAKEIGVVKKIKFADKGLNLERLGRHLKLFTDKVEVTGLEGLYERLQQARKSKQNGSMRSPTLPCASSSDAEPTPTQPPEWNN